MRYLNGVSYTTDSVRVLIAPCDPGMPSEVAEARKNARLLAEKLEANMHLAVRSSFSSHADWRDHQFSVVDASIQALVDEGNFVEVRITDIRGGFEGYSWLPTAIEEGTTKRFDADATYVPPFPQEDAQLPYLGLV